MRIVAALDRSPVSDAVIEMTLRIASRNDTRVLLINVAPRQPDVLGQQLVRKVITEPVPKELRDRRDLLDRHLATLAKAGIDCATLLIRGQPGPTVVSEAQRWGAELIVMGSHGRGLAYRKLMGSVSEAVLKAGRQPVLVIPARASLKATAD